MKRYETIRQLRAASRPQCPGTTRPVPTGKVSPGFRGQPRCPTHCWRRNLRHNPGRAIAGVLVGIFSLLPVTLTLPLGATGGLLLGNAYRRGAMERGIWTPLADALAGADADHQHLIDGYNRLVRLRLTLPKRVSIEV